uniref:Serine protease inhibitor n=1 Tax=Amblyomma americanum TaxID=6943 RepID=A0A0E9Y140_AMBAM
MVNAIYFKANWVYLFNPRDTSSDDFHLDAQNTVQVEMMSQEGEYAVSDSWETNCRVLEMPYKGGEYSMVIVLPNEIDGLTSLEERLAEYDLRSLLNGLETKPLVQLSIPKFKVQKKVGMNDVLRALGVKDLFDNERADLSGIFDNGSPSVSGIIHEAVVEVNENGTVAAAASAAIGVGSAGPSRNERIKFIADHPFLFLIKRNQGNLILFMGSVRNPKA